MNAIIKWLERYQPFFEKVSRNIYLQSIKDGFVSCMPLILFSSLFLLIASLPATFGIVLPQEVVDWCNKVYNYTMGLLGVMVAGTTAKVLTGFMNHRMPEGKRINETSTMVAAMCGFLLLAVSTFSAEVDGAAMTGFDTGYMGSKGLLSSFVSAFLTVHIYRFCVVRDITIRLPKEVPGAIAQSFRDIFPFSFAIIACGLIDLVCRNLIGAPFGMLFQTLLSPLFNAADSPAGVALWFFLSPLFWFMGIHGPSIVKPPIQAALIENSNLNLELFTAGQHPYHLLCENFGNFIGQMGGTGATFLIPLIFILFMKSRQAKAVGKASIIPCLFAVNEPLLFGAPIILNPYFLVPFILAPVANVLIGSFFILVLGMDGFMYTLPWSTPAPLGILLNTHFQWQGILLVAVLCIVDVLVYFPFCMAYDKQLLEEEGRIAEGEEVEGGMAAIRAAAEAAPVASGKKKPEDAMVAEREKLASSDKPLRVLVLCAGSGTSALLANALREGAEEEGIPLKSSSGAYGSHYDLLPSFDVVVLAPQVRNYYNDLKQDTDRLGIKLISTRGKEYIALTNDPKGAIEFVLSKMSEDE